MKIGELCKMRTDLGTFSSINWTHIYFKYRERWQMIRWQEDDKKSRIGTNLTLTIIWLEITT